MRAFLTRSLAPRFRRAPAPLAALAVRGAATRAPTAPPPLDLVRQFRANEPPVFVRFRLKNDKCVLVAAADGSNLLDVAHEAGVPVEGACGGSLACSTCHVILADPEQFERLPPPSEREDDLLDMAPCLTEQSRLACQVHLDRRLLREFELTAEERESSITPETREALDACSEPLKGLEVHLPKSTINFYLDGHVPEAH